MTNAPTSPLAGADGFAVAAPLLSLTTTTLYFAAIALCAVLLRIRSRRDASSVTLSRIAMWTGLLGSLFLLCLNQHANLLGIAVQAVRDIAYEGGWYENRRPIQVAVIVAALATSAFGAWFVLFRPGRIAPGYTRLAVGAIALLVFVSIRELSLHHVDSVMSLKLASLSIGRLGEAVILLTMVTGAARWVSFTRRPVAQAA